MLTTVLFGYPNKSYRYNEIFKNKKKLWSAHLFLIGPRVFQICNQLHILLTMMCSGGLSVKVTVITCWLKP